MKIFEMNLELSAYDTQSNIKIPFQLKENYSSMSIYFSYLPNKSNDYVAREQVKAALRKYGLDVNSPEGLKATNYLPIDNLITLSLSKNGQYLGAHHNKLHVQEVHLSKAGASKGFVPVTIEPAMWELQLNCHCVASKIVEASIRIEVEK